MSAKLTPTQSRALKFIQEKIETSGVAPSLREICGHMGYSAIGSAQDLISALRKKGFLETPDKQAARSIIPTALTRRARHTEDFDANTYLVPCLGTVPAGNPVEAVEEHVGTLRLSIAMLPSPRPRADELFALQASGESMIDAGIHDGDWLVVRLQQEAKVGDIAVARIEGDATVKRLLKDKQRGWYLQPENPRFQPVYADESSFEIVGKVIALQRVLI